MGNWFYVKTLGSSVTAGTMIGFLVADVQLGFANLACFFRSPLAVTGQVLSGQYIIKGNN